jgi:hypothetical protein
MKRAFFLIIISGLFFQHGISAESPGDSLWAKTFGGVNDDKGWCVQQTSDNGYVTVGWTDSFGAGSYDIYLIKTDESGDTVWTKTYGEDGSDDGRCVRQTSDGGYVIAGNTQPIGIMGSYLQLIKTDSIGDIVWTKTWGETPVPNINTGRCVQLTSDGGYIISGHAQYLGPDNDEDVFLVKTDSNGDTEWQKFYGGSAYEIGYWTQQTSDGGYVVVGYTTTFGAGNEDVYLVKTDASGTVEWTKTYGGTGTDSAYSVQQTPDNGYIMAGVTDSSGAGNYDVYVIRTDEAGEVLWDRTYGGANFDKGYSVQSLSDGTFIVSGTTRSFGDSSGDVYLLKLDAAGDVLWSNTYDAGDNDRGWSVQPTSDGDYIVAGYSHPAGHADVLLLKVAGDVPIFVDGFESGDTSAWSAGQP